MAAAIAELEHGTLADRVTQRILEITGGRIQDLAVEVVRGDVVVWGVVRTHHLRQLALQGALESAEGRRCRPYLTVR